MFDEEPHSNAFRGVRFVLLGFNPLTETEHEVRSKLVGGGGVDAGQYCHDCTHVIVDALVHDDPVCVAARRDGKTLVTSLWVYHSSDTGMLVDSSSIMYQPLKDLDGIPGAKSLVICLTGYQRQDRDDIMTMVGLMGAQFSKPLVANKVTHLICYKFEGEKYELAKKMKKINLVNHQWLEDCLRAWEIVPEVNYNTSGYDLEIMEVEAKDSEEEAEDIGMENLAGRRNNGSPCHSKGKMSSAPELPLPVGRASPDAARGFSIADHGQDVLLSTANNSTSDQASCLNAIDKKKLQLCSDHDTVAFGNANSGKLSETPVSNRVRNGMTSISSSADMCIQSGGNSSALSYLRKTPRKSNLPICLDGTSHSEAYLSSKAHLGEDNAREENAVGAGSSISTLKGTNLSREDGSSDSLFQKRKTDISCSGFKSPSKSPKTCLDFQPGALGCPSVSSRKQGLEAASASHCEAYHSKSSLGEHSVREENAIGMASSINPPKGTNLSCEEGFSSLLPQKRKVDISCSSSKSPKMGHDFLPGVSGSPSMCNRKRVLEAGSPLKAPFEADKESSSIKNGHSIDTDIHTVPSSSTNVLATNSVPNDDNLHIACIPLSKTVSSEAAEDEKTKTKASLKHYGRLKKPMYAGKPHTEGSAMDITKTWSEPNCKDVEGSPNMKAAETENSLGHTDLDIQERGNGNSKPKSSKRSMVAGKNLSSRPKVSPSSTANQKGSLYLNKTSYQRDVANSKTSVEERTDLVTSSKGCKSHMSASVVNAESLQEMRKEKDQDAKTDSMHEEAEAPEHKDEVGIVNDVNHEAEAMPEVDVMMQEKPEGVRGISNKTKTEILGLHCDNMALNAGENETEPEMVVCSKEHELSESALKADTFKRKKIKAQKHPFGLTKAKARRKVEMAEKRVSQPTSMTKISNSPGTKMDSNMKMEKENKPVADGSQKRSQSKQCAAKVDGKDSRVTKTYQKAGKVDTDLEQGLVSNRRETESVCFILSGHRLQRKEFQQVIKTLKGRFCRDSHHWSYQATHFIAPEPIRRTEKFFAAAASGRWILKTDYLAGSIREGKFLPEEPYEWHKNGLNEDGAINLEAPRKWRLLREKTGHGALYGMRIVIYGECIAPPLDTLKRVIKAGDGSIVATSPPYTRFLKTGVDFAIVCPGMPRADVWVQEFLSHEIPCVSADYLVEYVCKPGYPLDKHVLYNTNDWAEKSLSNLVLLSEEVLGNLKPIDDSGSGDLSCEVCGSCDRGEVMLICGNESGSVGCGIGTHIDCCDPPLEFVPVEDWFCPTCSESRPLT